MTKEADIELALGVIVGVANELGDEITRGGGDPKVVTAAMLHLTIESLIKRGVTREKCLVLAGDAYDRAAALLETELLIGPETETDG